MTIPHFKFSVSNPNDKDFGFISVGNDRIHRVANTNEFYEALGYTTEIRHTGLLADEFIWAEYRKDGSAKSRVCLQAKIIEYLDRHSASFAEKYASQLSNWMGSCPEGRLREPANCGDCLLHPMKKP